MYAPTIWASAALGDTFCHEMMLWPRARKWSRPDWVVTVRVSDGILLELTARVSVKAEGAHSLTGDALRAVTA